MDSPKFHYYPKEWGMQLHYTGPPVSLDKGDLELLRDLREYYDKEHGTILSWKFDLKPIRNLFPGLLLTLNRLWKNGRVVKFAGQDHTVHGNPEYIKWYIWEETTDDEGETIWGDTRAPGYIVQR